MKNRRKKIPRFLISRKVFSIIFPLKFCSWCVCSVYYFKRHSYLPFRFSSKRLQEPVDLDIRLLLQDPENAEPREREPRPLVPEVPCLGNSLPLDNFPRLIHRNEYGATQRYGFRRYQNHDAKS
ncbi:uncharacterized protein LOC107272861 isoform X2 [Cephus cinctus]|uniref:Uncharacterized protein LOC107272861 isoform X2 n=1 Tax=Cephus cinctus TaxID=211228 RepID=A0AAJ7W6Q6_CEPCN|nr:uncharacterized protein LOC107272861 isoform X2 [Cephus cinctus]